MPHLHYPRSSTITKRNALNTGLFLAASSLAVYGLMRRSSVGMALAAAGGLVAVKTSSATFPAKEYSTKINFLANTSPEQAYRLWRNLENLPRFMSHIKSIRVLDNQRSEWIARGPMDSDVKWVAEIIEDRASERISWHSLPNSDVTNEGSVEFSPGPTNRGTMITAQVKYKLLSGTAGRTLLSILGKDPQFMLREELRRFKALIEAGEVPTTAGQPHGPRGLHGNVEQILFRERSNRPAPHSYALHRSA
jgi:uncharacterized membrane protein